MLQTLQPRRLADDRLQVVEPQHQRAIPGHVSAATASMLGVLQEVAAT
jgi:hypothetical protein